MRSIALVTIILFGMVSGCAATRTMGHRLAMSLDRGLFARSLDRSMILDTVARGAEDAPREQRTAEADGRVGWFEGLLDRVSGMMPCGMMGRMLMRPPDRGVEP